MSDVFRKLQFKDQPSIRVVGAPPEFEPHLDEVRDRTRVVTGRSSKPHPFVLVFVRSRTDIERRAGSSVASLEEDGLLWFAYPKKSSKRYDSDISRDDGWQPLGRLGFEGVRQIAIDADWSALRLRKPEFIKSMKRATGRAMTSEGKRRTR